jgi:tetratricopeptide (TPR) repeat protein
MDARLDTWVHSEIKAQQTISEACDDSSQAHESVASVIVRPIEQAALVISEFDREIAHSWVSHAALLIKSGEIRTAQTLLRNALNKEPKNERAIRLMATCLERSGRTEEALKCLKVLVRLFPRLEYKFDLAHMFYSLEDDDQAFQLYQEMLTSEALPESSAFEIFKNLGNIHVRRGDFEAAEDCYNRAFNADSKSDILYVNFGTLEINRDNLEAAGERFRAALDINDKNDRAWVGLALVHRAKGDFELSWANLERAIDLNPRNRTALRLIVEWGVRDGRVQSAAERLESYLAIDGEDAEMAFAFAKCLTLIGRMSDALLECERVVALDPEQIEALRLRRVLAERILAESESTT